MRVQWFGCELMAYQLLLASLPPVAEQLGTMTPCLARCASCPLASHRPHDDPPPLDRPNSWMSRRFETPDCGTDDGIVCHQVHREIAPAKKISLENETILKE